MSRKRVHIVVTVDLDPVPGTFHEVDDHVQHINRVLNDVYPHYHPDVRPLTHVNHVVDIEDTSYGAFIFGDDADVAVEGMNNSKGQGWAFADTLPILPTTTG